MNAHPLAIVIATLLFILNLPNFGYSEAQFVKIRFEIDGKPKGGPKNIEFYAKDGSMIACEHIHDGVFRAPIIEPSNMIDVHLRFARRNMVFRDIYAAKLQGRWIIGIDRRPFHEENLSSSIDLSKQKELWFIEFNPLNAEGTRMVVVAR